MPTVAIPSRTATPTPTAEELLSRKLDAIGFRASLVRDLSGRGPVERAFINKNELEQKLLEDLEKDREDILVTQKLYELLGITEEGTDLIELLTSVYGDIVLGFFDTEDDILYVVGDKAEFDEQDELTVAHEYVHGLQQLHFDIQALGESVEDNSDQRRALTALIEGDASLAQFLYMWEYFDADQQEAAQSALSDADVEAFRAAPLVIQRVITFPYVEGASFVVALYLETNGFELVDKAYQRPPLSTEQIIHPAKYIASEEPMSVALPEISASLGGGWAEMRQNTFGELFLRSYLESGIGGPEASTAAAGWGGDRYGLYEGPGGAMAMGAITAWDTEEDASEFFDAFRPFAQAGAEGEWEAVEAIPSTFVLHDDERVILLSRTDTLEVQFVIAPSQELGLAVLKGMKPGSEGG